MALTSVLALGTVWTAAAEESGCVDFSGSYRYGGPATCQHLTRVKFDGLQVPTATGGLWLAKPGQEIEIRQTGCSEIEIRAVVGSFLPSGGWKPIAAPLKSGEGGVGRFAWTKEGVSVAVKGSTEGARLGSERLRYELVLTEMPNGVRYRVRADANARALWLFPIKKAEGIECELSRIGSEE